MCCFSGEVRHVANTKIFARLDAGSPDRRSLVRQTLVYSMDFAAASDVAMLLPIPVARGSGEQAVTFTSLEKVPAFFELVEQAFPQPQSARSNSDSADRSRAPRELLEVKQVGAFEASFVPSPADLDRLDPRFRLPEAALAVLTRRATREATFPDMSQAEWDALPDYRDWGFCVFKLRASATPTHAHPMAFSFPTRWPDRIFFPTAHVHDGRLPRAAAFDHALYLQTGGRSLPDGGPRWRESERPLGAHLDAQATGGLVDPDDHAYTRRLRGRLTNGDVLVAVVA